MLSAMFVKLLRLVGAWLWLCMVPYIAQIHAAELIPPGMHPKLMGGAGQTVSRGCSAAFYNPANFIYSKLIEPCFDISYAQVKYTYTHPDSQFDPVKVSIGTTPITAGVNLRLIPALAAGVALVPTGTGSIQNVQGVPYFIGLPPNGETKLVDIRSSNTGYKVGAGIAARLGHFLTLGGGLILTSEKSTLIVEDAANSGTQSGAIIDYQWGGTFNEFIVGARSELLDRRIVLAASYRKGGVKKYKGDGAFLTEEEYTDKTIVGFNPDIIGFGGEIRFGPVGLFVDYTRESWIPGRNLVRTGITGEPETTDLKNTNNFAGGIKIWPAGKHMIVGAGGYYPTSVGYGYNAQMMGEDADPELEDMAGMSFGNMNGITRTVGSVGYRYKFTNHGYLDLGGQYVSGTRKVPEGNPSEGTHTLSIMMGTAGLAFGF